MRFAHMLAYDATRGEAITYGGAVDNQTLLDDTWTYRVRMPTSPSEGCHTGIDGDGDGTIGCADPDCYGVCSPLCNPTEVMACDQTLPRCGDGMCQPVESQRSCPGDCGAPTPVCGNFVCESAETMANCPGDCS